MTASITNPSQLSCGWHILHSCLVADTTQILHVCHILKLWVQNWFSVPLQKTSLSIAVMAVQLLVHFKPDFLHSLIHIKLNYPQLLILLLLLPISLCERDQFRYNDDPLPSYSTLTKSTGPVYIASPVKERSFAVAAPSSYDSYNTPLAPVFTSYAPAHDHFTPCLVSW